MYVIVIGHPMSPGGFRGITTEWGLRCGAVCGHAGLRPHLHHLPGGPTVPSESHVPSHLLQEMHFAMAEEVQPH